MSPYLSLRRAARHLSTTTAAVKPVKPARNISQTKARLKNAHDPDEALKIYSSFAANTAAAASSPSAARYVQELTVRRLAKSQRFSDIKTFLDSHKSDPQITHEPFLSSLIRSYAAVGMYENALNTYHEMTDLATPRTAISFNALLSACIRCKVLDRVPVYFREFPAKFGFEPDKFSYGILIKAHCEMGSPEAAIEIVREMEEKGVEIGAVSCTTVLHKLYDKGLVDEAVKFWDEMVERDWCTPDVGCYNVRLMHIHRGKPERVKGFIEEMINAGIRPDAITYNYLISCYCVNGMMDQAMEVYNDEMLKGKGCKPNSATYRTLVFNLCKKGRFMSGYKVFKQSVNEHKIPDFNTLKYLVEGLAKKGHVREAKAMVRTMNKKFPPNLLKAWGKIAEELGLANFGDEEVGSGEMEKGVGSDETEKAST